MSRLHDIYTNRWVRFSVVSLIYVLWFVVWGRSPWMLLGLLVIFDIYISRNLYRLFWRRHLERKRDNGAYRSVMGWVESIVFAVVAATLIRTYFVEMYVIPTGSMEKTLLIGDCLGVSKVAYGPKMPNTPLSMPFIHNVSPLDHTKKSYLEWIRRPYKRLCGLDTLERGDVVVFNNPEGDTVALISPQSNYYQLVRMYGRREVLRQSDIMVHPVDKRDNYIKRAVAIAGDTLQLREGNLFVNGDSVALEPYAEVFYNVTGKGLDIDYLMSLGVRRDEIGYNDFYKVWQLPLYRSQYDALVASGRAETVRRAVMREVEPDIFPHDTTRYRWSVDNFGPLWVPQKGATVALNIDNLPLYSRVIKDYEGNDLQVRGGDIYINGQKSDSYTFKMNYYFMMGDNRHQSLDSRYFGFVPEDHVVGRAWFILFSTDKDKSFPANIRFGRMFSRIR
ncbi:MAG: signal peptidase I [Rikenellaceae bacterium]|nr:signal peptidase I [Rikenellaceae bacterium]